VLLRLYGCLVRAVRTGVPYGCQNFTLADRKDRPYTYWPDVRRKKWRPYVRSFLTAHTYG